MQVPTEWAEGWNKIYSIHLSPKKQLTGLYIYWVCSNMPRYVQKYMQGIVKMTSLHYISQKLIKL